MEDLYAALGYGKYSARQVAGWREQFGGAPSLLRPPERPAALSPGDDRDLVVQVKGHRRSIDLSRQVL
jgi:hypothetical protein